MILQRIKAKITRAKQHINDFQLGRTDFFKTNPYGVAIKEDAERGKRVYYVSKVDPVPYGLAAIAADIIQNLRSPLDHIAHQLVVDGLGGAEPDWMVYYPISGGPAYYEATRKGKVKGVRQEVIDAIDATEPYKGGKGHALWQLNELNKPDKHELLIGAATIAAGVDISPDFAQSFRNMKYPEGFPNVEAFRNINIPPLFIREANTVPLHEGYELYIEPLDKEVAKERRFSFDISLNAPGIIAPEPALKTLQDMANLVDEITTTLGRLLP